MTDFRGKVIIHETITRGRRIINYLSTSDEDVVDFTDSTKFYDFLSDKVNLVRVKVSNRKHGVTSESLSQKWLKSPEVANRIVQHTTHCGTRKIPHPPLSRQFKTNDRALRYNSL